MPDTPALPLADPAAYRTGARAAAVTLAGTLLSGPVALALVAVSRPQPSWRGVETFVAHHHVVQTLPYFFGLLLVGGFVALVASLHAVAPPDLRARSAAALAFVAAFAALVTLNYVLQTTFVPALVREPLGDTRLIAALTMSNPTSLGWALEMWGYGLLGVATWLVAPVFRGSRLERAAAFTFVLNGPMSIVSALWTALDPGWVLTLPGLIGFGVWNVLVVAMSALAFVCLHRRAQRFEAGLKLGRARAQAFSTRM